MIEPVVNSQALAALPHGPAFRFIDELIALVPGRFGRGVYHVRGDEAFLEGHFPGAPMMPGVLLIEAVAQLAGVVAQSDPSRMPVADLRLAAVRAARINGSAIPGQTIEVEAEITGRLGTLIHAQGKVLREGATLVTTQIVLGSARPA